MFNIKGKRVLVLGLGILGGGREITRWAIKSGAQVIVTDNKSKMELSTSVKVLKNLPIVWHLGGHQLSDFMKVDLIIQNPAVPNDLPALVVARQKKVPIFNEAGLFFLLAKRPLVGVTGTRGKSTTTAMLHSLLQSKYPQALLAGNIGDRPMFGIISEAQKRSPAPIILELSSWQVEGLRAVKKSPPLAILTNLYPDHLNRYANQRAYYLAKFQLFAWQKKTDHAIFNLDNSEIRKNARRITRAKIYWFSLKSKALPGWGGAYVKQGNIYFRKNKQTTLIMRVADLPLAENHNLANALAAITAAKLQGLNNNQIKSGFKKFKPLWGRQQYVGTRQGRLFYNDTTATSPEGALVALHSFTQPPIMIMGGQNKGLSYRQLAKQLVKRAKAVVFLPGTASDILLAELKKINNSKLVIRQVSTLKQAIKVAVKLSVAGEAIILSPGAASFNLFRNEFDRGEQFVALVNKEK